MKLRNKKTGEVDKLIEYGNDIIPHEITEFIIETEEHDYKYISLTKLIEEWEDYKPAEPLIKDEKIRKAVRAWADANRINGCVCKDEIHCVTFETERGMFISFENADPIPPEGNYTIAELCGEEEE